MIGLSMSCHWKSGIIKIFDKNATEITMRLCYKNWITKNAITTICKHFPKFSFTYSTNLRKKKSRTVQPLHSNANKIKQHLKKVHLKFENDIAHLKFVKFIYKNNHGTTFKNIFLNFKIYWPPLVWGRLGVTWWLILIFE